MESNESDIGWQWGEQAKAWVQLADSASTVAEAATIWGYDEELATQWITGWALHHGWAHELHTEGIEQIWHKLRNDTWADAQLDTQPWPSTTERTPPSTGTPTELSPEELLAGLAGEKSVEKLATEWGLTEQQVVAWGGQLAQEWWGWSITTAVELEVLRAELRAPRLEAGHSAEATPLPRLNETQVQVLAAVAQRERPTLADIARDLRMRPAMIRARLETIGEDLRIQGTATQILTALVPRLREGGDLAALELPWHPVPILPPTEVAFSLEQTRLLVALRDLEHPTMNNLAEPLGVRRHTLAARLEATGRDLGIKGTATDILTTLVEWVRPPGILAELVSSWTAVVPVPSAPPHARLEWSEADIDDLLADAPASLLQAGPPPAPEWSEADIDDLLADAPASLLRSSPFTEPESGEVGIDRSPAGAPSGPTQEEMVEGLAGGKSLDELADEWHLTVEQVVDWACQLAHVLWGWPITTPVEQVRAQLRTPTSGIDPRIEDDPATPLPEFTEPQLQVLSGLRHLERPTLNSLVDALGSSRSTIESRLKSIAGELGFEGTATQIINALTPRSRGVGDLSGLELPWNPVPGPVRAPSSETYFTVEQTLMLAAVRDARPLSMTAVGDALGVTRQSVATRLKTVGRILGILGTGTEILTTLVPRLGLGGDLAGLVSHLPPPDRPPSPPSPPIPAPVDAAYTEGQRWVLAALRHLEGPTRADVADVLHLPLSTVTHRLEAIGQLLGIEGTATEILDTLIWWVRPPGDLAQLSLPWPPPDQPVRSQGNRKRRRGNESRSRTGT